MKWVRFTLTFFLVGAGLYLLLAGCAYTADTDVYEVVDLSDYQRCVTLAGRQYLLACDFVSSSGVRCIFIFATNGVQMGGLDCDWERNP